MAGLRPDRRPVVLGAGRGRGAGQHPRPGGAPRRRPRQGAHRRRDVRPHDRRVDRRQRPVPMRWAAQRRDPRRLGHARGGRPGPHGIFVGGGVERPDEPERAPPPAPPGDERERRRVAGRQRGFGRGIPVLRRRRGRARPDPRPRRSGRCGKHRAPGVARAPARDGDPPGSGDDAGPGRRHGRVVRGAAGRGRGGSRHPCRAGPVTLLDCAGLGLAALAIALVGAWLPARRTAAAPIASVLAAE